MSTTSLDKELQERLREASAIGDIDEVRILVESGVNVNSQNEINGWTCLHWACKRNHKPVVSYLLNSGADQEILTAKDELAVQLTSKPEIRRLLGVEEEEVPEIKEPELPIIPNYLSNPPFMYSKMDNKAELILAQLTQNGNGDHSSDDPHSDSASLSPTHEQQLPQQPQSLLSDTPSPREGAFIPLAQQNGVSPSPASSLTINGGLPMDISMEPHLVNHGSTHTRWPIMGLCALLPCPPPAPAPPALVLKVRIQNPNARENDFIEVELDRQELTYRSLLRVCCRELDISTEHVEKIRKLPNTMLRKDKDVARLQDFQELEVVLEKAEGLALLSGAGGLTDRPCYNMKASRLTY
uniref:Ankyrin repeat domain-containing protein 40 n=1 Tax=Oncorhynchus tshawytscha TaxID=74940 RepID=A0AAZ3R5L8_ONCTS